MRSIQRLMLKVLLLALCIVMPSPTGGMGGSAAQAAGPGIFAFPVFESPLLRRPTLGGAGAWTDYMVYGDWRIQRHYRHGGYRLLDDRDRLVASGEMPALHRELCERVNCGEVPRMTRHVVVVVHGLAGSRRLMEPLVKSIRRCDSRSVINVGFASRRGTIEELTLGLESVLRNLHGVHDVSLVCHSMSGLMVRHLLYRQRNCSRPLPVNINRMVMISPPNHGSELADTLGQRPVIEAILGDSVDQLAPSVGWACLESKLDIPAFPVGIIAGGKCDGDGYMRAIAGDDDSVVGISSHYLPGAADFIQVGGLHQIMPLYRRTQDATIRFLRYGHF